MKTIENDNTKERKKGRECLCSPSVLVVTVEKNFSLTVPHLIEYSAFDPRAIVHDST